MDENVSKHPENQQNGEQHFLKYGTFLKILTPDHYIVRLEQCNVVILYRIILFGLEGLGLATSRTARSVASKAVMLRFAHVGVVHIRVIAQTRIHVHNMQAPLAVHKHMTSVPISARTEYKITILLTQDCDIKKNLLAIFKMSAFLSSTCKQQISINALAGKTDYNLPKKKKKKKKRNGQ